MYSTEKIRLLLVLLNAAESNDPKQKDKKLRRNDLKDQAKSKEESSQSYESALQELEEQGIVSFVDKVAVLDREKGVDALSVLLQEADTEGADAKTPFFKGTIAGSKYANALLKLAVHLAKTPTAVQLAPQITEEKPIPIAAYEEFTEVVLEVYDRLNYEFNYDNLVPIYKIRRAIGDRVTRTQFNDWMLEMQTNDILQLQGGGVEDDARDKLEDSVMTKFTGLRCYAKKLS